VLSTEILQCLFFCLSLQGFDAFINLPHGAQSALLKNNADMIVSLRGAVFFEKRKGGLDQVS
jgi:hypothetical protein